MNIFEKGFKVSPCRLVNVLPRWSQVKDTRGSEQIFPIWTIFGKLKKYVLNLNHFWKVLKYIFKISTIYKKFKKIYFKFEQFLKSSENIFLIWAIWIKFTSPGDPPFIYIPFKPTSLGVLDFLQYCSCFTGRHIFQKKWIEETWCSAMWLTTVVVSTSPLSSTLVVAFTFPPQHWSETRF